MWIDWIWIIVGWVQGRPPISPLNRSQTDSNIHYPYEDLPEASGATGFVSKEGGFDFHVLLEVSISNRHLFRIELEWIHFGTGIWTRRCIPCRCVRMCVRCESARRHWASWNCCSTWASFPATPSTAAVAPRIPHGRHPPTTSTTRS